jgi:hypothetical protein
MKDEGISQDKLAQMRDKVMKLLNLTTSNGATPAEAATAFNKANEILEKYNLSMDEIRAPKEETELIHEYINGIMYDWETRLHQVLAKHNMCLIVRIKSEGKAMLLGRRLNVIAHYLTYSWICGQLYKRMNDQLIVEKPQNPFAWREAFFYGAVVAINERVEELSGNRYMKYPNCKALVEDRDAELRRFFEELTGSRIRTSKRVVPNGPGYSNGYSAGRLVSFGDEPVLTDKKRMLTGR